MTHFTTTPLAAHNHPDEVTVEACVEAFIEERTIPGDRVALAIAGWFSASPDETPALSALVADGYGDTGLLGEELLLTRQDGLEQGWGVKEMNMLETLDAWVADKEG